MQRLLRSTLDQGMTYRQYRDLLTELLAEGKTTGPNQAENYLEAARLNQHRMDRLDRKARFSPAMETLLASLDKPYLLLALTEGWCGDAAQLLPLINHMAEATDQLSLQLVLRDENLELMDHFLTDGGRGIPKVLVLDPERLEVLADWGPRPEPAQALAMDYKYQREPKMDYDTYNKALHTWYARDKTQTAQEELVALFKELK
ncbi:MAG: thioredoxin family protein [Bacteroidota bacterium]